MLRDRGIIIILRRVELIPERRVARRAFPFFRRCVCVHVLPLLIVEAKNALDVT